jgi:hypothetical protein
MQAAVHVQRRDKVRLYNRKGWFLPGLVKAVDAEADTVDVDYGDYVQRYAREDLRLTWPPDGTYEAVLVPVEIGVIIADYRMVG